MKIPYSSLAILAGASVVLSSCVEPAVGYYTPYNYGAPVGYAGSGWTNASYDADGFPIFGYVDGRPVYGYTSAGVAIFTIAALTALCFVPHWKPAPWYRGHHHYPVGIHRVPAPPRFPAGHAPGVRPPAGAHRGPGAPHMAPPRGGVHHAPGAPRGGAAPHPGMRGAAPNGMRPHANMPANKGFRSAGNNRGFSSNARPNAGGFNNRMAGPNMGRSAAPQNVGRVSAPQHVGGVSHSMPTRTGGASPANFGSRSGNFGGSVGGRSGGFGNMGGGHRGFGRH